MRSITIEHGPVFNHGCTDFANVEVDGDDEGTVAEVNSCHSCWQVGHDADHEFLAVGTRVKFWNVDEYGVTADWEVV